MILHSSLLVYFGRSLTSFPFFFPQLLETLRLLPKVRYIINHLFFLHLNYQPTISRFYAGGRFCEIFIIETNIDTWPERVETRGMALVKRSYSSAFAEGRRYEQTRWSGCKAESRSFKEKKIEWTVAHSSFIYHLSPQIILIYVPGQKPSWLYLTRNDVARNYYFPTGYLFQTIKII